MMFSPSMSLDSVGLGWLCVTALLLSSSVFFFFFFFFFLGGGGGVVEEGSLVRLVVCSLWVVSVCEFGCFRFGFGAGLWFWLPVPDHCLPSYFVLYMTIMLKCPCSLDPLTPHFYMGKLGFKRVCIIFALKHRLWVLVRRDVPVVDWSSHPICV